MAVKDHVAVAQLRFMPVTGAVSLNRREYPQSTVEKVINRAQERLASGEAFPLTALTHHEAGDDNLRIVGKISGTESLYQEDGWWCADAQIADTAAGRDIAYLASNGYLVSCSLRGSNPEVDWHDDNESAMPTVLDFELEGVDFTNYPGIAGTPSGDAKIGKVTWEAVSKESVLHEKATDQRVIDTFAIGAGLTSVDENLAHEIVERQEAGDKLNEIGEVLVDAIQPLLEAPRAPSKNWYHKGADTPGSSAPGNDAPAAVATDPEMDVDEDPEGTPTSEPGSARSNGQPPSLTIQTPVIKPQTMPAPTHNPATAPYQGVVDNPGPGVNKTGMSRPKRTGEVAAVPMLTHGHMHTHNAPATEGGQSVSYRHDHVHGHPDGEEHADASAHMHGHVDHRVSGETVDSAPAAPFSKKKAKSITQSDSTGIYLEQRESAAQRLAAFAAGAERVWGTPAATVMTVLQSFQFATSRTMVQEQNLTLSMDDFGAPPVQGGFGVDMKPAPSPVTRTPVDGDGDTSALTTGTGGEPTAAPLMIPKDTGSGIHLTRVDGELSYEDIRCMLEDAVADTISRACYAYVVATGAKAFVYCRVGGGDGDFDYDDTSYWRQEYSFSANDVTLQGTPQPYMLTFAPAPSGQEETALEKAIAERLDRLTAAIEMLAGKPEPPVESEGTETTETVATRTLAQRLETLEAQLADATDPAKVLQTIVALKNGRKGMVATTESANPREALQAIYDDKVLAPEEKLRRVLELTSPDPAQRASSY